jgi:osmotically-inducible protein OsmY
VVVALTGFVRRYSDKQDAEAAAKRVAGVVGVANDIEVRLPSVDQRPDPEIAREAVAAINSRLPAAWEHIKVVVNDGWVTLEGEVQWQYQRRAAERGLPGVKGISNMIRIKPLAKPAEIGRRIEEAIKRNAQLDANRISVKANGSEVILKGHRSVLARARRGGTGGVVGAGCHDSEKSDRCERRLRRQRSGLSVGR